MSERALVRNAGDRKQLKRADRTKRQEALEESANLESVLTTYDGRAVLWRILARCHPEHTSHRGEETHATSYQEGERNIGLWLRALICTTNLVAYHEMETEAAKRAEMIVEPPPKSDDPFPATDTQEDDDGN